MSQKRWKFSPQFKAEAVQFVIETGRLVLMSPNYSRHVLNGSLTLAFPIPT